MKKIEEIVNQIHLGKWEEVMPQIPDNSVDIVISSPPYNVSLGDNKFKKDAYENYDDDMPYDQYLDWMESLFTECYRVLKHGGRIAINIGDRKQSKEVTHVDFIVRMRKIGFIMLVPIVWHKGQIGNRFAWGIISLLPCLVFQLLLNISLLCARVILDMKAILIR